MPHNITSAAVVHTSPLISPLPLLSGYSTISVITTNQPSSVYYTVSFACNATTSAALPSFIPTQNGGYLLYEGQLIRIPVGMLGEPSWRLYGAPQPYYQPPLPNPAIVRRRLLAGRKALRRSIDLFCMLRPEREIRTFLHGEPLMVRGYRHDYRVQKRENVLQHTMHPNSEHIPYHLHLIDRDSGKDVAKGCIIIPKTPVIDQLLALILNVQDRAEELSVLKTANWSPRLPKQITEELAA